MIDTTPAPAERWLPLPVATGRQVATHMWRRLAGRKLRLCAILVLFVGEAAAALVFPLVIGGLVDAIIAAPGTEVPATFWWTIALLVTAALACGALSWGAAVAIARLAETVIAELREDYVAAALHLPRRAVEAAGTGDIVTRASDDIAHVSGTLPDVLPNVCVSVFTIALAASGIGLIDPLFLLGFVIVVPLYALAARWYLRTAPPVYAAERTAQSRRGQHVLSTFTHLATVTAHRLERRQLDRVSDSTWQTVRWTMRARIVQNRLFGRLNIAQALGLATILALGVWLALSGATTPGMVTAAALLFLSTISPIESLLFIMDDLQAALASLGRLVGVINEPRASAGASETEAPEAGDDLIALDRVCFSYRGDRTVLSDIDLRIRPGQRIAVVGATGSGKSTLAALIAGTYEPTGGVITRTIEAERILTLTQEVHVFAGTLADNLRLARPAATDDELHAALRSVSAEHIAHALPEALDTMIGHGAHSLTAADAQHLALARLVLADPVMVVMDEATAESDSADSDTLDRAALAALAGRTAIVIAHRLSQAVACDQILVLDDGRIVEHGTHDDLIASGGSYARLWESWSA